jgi:hypothetical protein
MFVSITGEFVRAIKHGLYFKRYLMGEDTSSVE